MERKDELSVIMLISKLRKAADFAQIHREVDADYLKEATADSPAYLLDIIAQIIEILLLKVNVPREEAEAFAGQVKERPMGELFANFEAYDVQETRRVARQEGRREGRQEGRREGRREGAAETLIRAIKMVREIGASKEAAKQQMMKQFGLSSEEAEEKLKLYW